jgi:ribonucleoside-triphosphate reductase
MNEACLNARWIKHDLTNKDAQDFTIEVLNHMRTASPIIRRDMATSSTSKPLRPNRPLIVLAKHDKEKISGYHHRWQSRVRLRITPTSSHLPVGYTNDIFSALDIEDRFQTLYTSGTVFHAFLGQKTPELGELHEARPQDRRELQAPLLHHVADLLVCEDHGYISGEVWKCPICGKETEVY